MLHDKDYLPRILCFLCNPKGLESISHLLGVLLFTDHEPLAILIFDRSSLFVMLDGLLIYKNLLDIFLLQL